MLNRDDLKTEVATVGIAEADVGSAIPTNMRRFIYAIKAINIAAVANLLTLRKVEDGGAAETIDYVQAAVQYDMWKDPDELKEDSAPLYVIEGAGAVGASHLRAVAGVASFYLTIWYIDAPA